ncbi:MAG TPA: FAD/NAD(P)-binding oxidoreductase, partial [Bacteroidota bacterium]
LSKALWKGDPEESIWLKTEGEGVTVQTRCTVERLDPAGKRVVDAGGTSYGFEKLLLATGGRVRRLPFRAEGIIYYRTYDDYKALQRVKGDGREVVVIGGGFIGSEIAAALAMHKTRVAMIFPDAGVGSRIFPPSLVHFLNDQYRARGIDLLAGDGVAGVEEQDGRLVVSTRNGRTIRPDGVVAGIGIQPNTTLAEQAGLRLTDGIEVDELLRTSHPDIYAAGDVANFYNPSLGRRLRVEHEDNANTMGEHAGRNMAGDASPYHHLPFFYSDLFEFGYEAVGDLDARLETVEQWKEEYTEGVIYYLKDGRVRGVLLWNTWGQVDAARALIAEKGPFNPQSVLGRLPA